ncbi:MAG: DUF58 domain-containing protein [Candidatus Riflebacteria bacterium]|nr:DUF58 domain-containing protein [Candidatus Riflebacteria bacterium]
MIQKKPKPLIEGLVLVIGSVLSVIAPFVVVPLALLVALVAYILIFFRSRDPNVPSLSDILCQGQIVVTTRVVLLLLFGTLPLMLAKSHSGAIALWLVYNFVVLMLVLTDIVISPRPENLAIERRVSQKLSIGRDNRVEIVVSNNSHRPLNLEIVDESPVEFGENGHNVILELDQRTSKSFSYMVKPVKRGCYYFNKTVVRFRGLLELVIFQQEYGEATAVEVYPDISSISRFELRMKRGQQAEAGLITERRRGLGSNFESLREYVSGDEFRRIDWKASARKNKLITREFQSEVNQSVLVVLDCSRSMGAVVDNLTLLDHAVNSALILGYQVMKKGDKIGLLAFSDKPQVFLPPGRGKAHYYSFLRHLYAISANRVEPDYDSVLRAVSATRLRRSLLMIITDLTSGEAVQKMLAAIPMVSRKHLTVVVSVLDPKLREIADAVPESVDAVYEKVVARNLIERVAGLSRHIEKIGVATMMITPQQLNSSLLSHYLQVKLRSQL